MMHFARRDLPGALARPWRRADQLSCNGNAAVHTPHLDRLAKEGAVFPNAF